MIRRSLARAGRWRLAALVARSSALRRREQLYQRQATRYCHELAFDLRYRVDTRGIVWNTGDEHSVHYQGTDARQFHTSFSRLRTTTASLWTSDRARARRSSLAAGYRFTAR